MGTGSRYHQAHPPSSYLPGRLDARNWQARRRSGAGPGSTHRHLWKPPNRHGNHGNLSFTCTSARGGLIAHHVGAGFLDLTTTVTANASCILPLQTPVLGSSTRHWLKKREDTLAGVQTHHPGPVPSWLSRRLVAPPAHHSPTANSPSHLGSEQRVPPVTPTMPPYRRQLGS